MFKIYKIIFCPCDYICKFPMSNNDDVLTSLYIEDYFINSGFPLQCLDDIFVLRESLSTLLSSNVWLSVIDKPFKSCKMVIFVKNMWLRYALVKVKNVVERYDQDLTNTMVKSSPKVHSQMTNLLLRLGQVFLVKALSDQGIEENHLLNFLDIPLRMNDGMLVWMCMGQEENWGKQDLGGGVTE